MTARRNSSREDAIAPPPGSSPCRRTRWVLDDLGGPELAVEGVRRRAGSILDPNLVETFAANLSGILDRTGDPREQLLEEEPHPLEERELGELSAIAAVFGDVADLKFPSLHGHSSGVAMLAVGAARTCVSTIGRRRGSRGRGSPARPRSPGRDERDLGEAGAADLSRVGTGPNACVPLRAHPCHIGHACSPRPPGRDAPRTARRVRDTTVAPLRGSNRPPSACSLPRMRSRR